MPTTFLDWRNTFWWSQTKVIFSAVFGLVSNNMTKKELKDLQGGVKEQVKTRLQKNEYL